MGTLKLKAMRNINTDCRKYTKVLCGNQNKIPLKLAIIQVFKICIIWHEQMWHLRISLVLPYQYINVYLFIFLSIHSMFDLVIHNYFKTIAQRSKIMFTFFQSKNIAKLP